MFPTSTFRLTFFDRALCAQSSVKKSQSNCGSREHLKILPYNIMTLPESNLGSIQNMDIPCTWEVCQIWVILVHSYLENWPLVLWHLHNNFSWGSWIPLSKRKLVYHLHPRHHTCFETPNTPWLEKNHFTNYLYYLELSRYTWAWQYIFISSWDLPCLFEKY